MRAALAWLAPEARDRPRIRILKRAGAVTDELRAWPATTDGHHFWGGTTPLGGSEAPEGAKRAEGAASARRDD